MFPRGWVRKMEPIQIPLGIVVYYIPINNLSHEHVMKHINDVKTNMINSVNHCRKAGFDVLFYPTHQDLLDIRIFRFSDGRKVKATNMEDCIRELDLA